MHTSYNVIVLGFASSEGTASLLKAVGIGILRAPHGKSYSGRTVDNLVNGVADALAIEVEQFESSLQNPAPLELPAAIALGDEAAARWTANGFPAPVVVFQ
jgi:hypothetical protein